MQLTVTTMSPKNQILKILRSILNPIGYEIVKYKSYNPSHIVLDHLKMNNIQTVLDVGANTGQYSLGLRKAGFKGRILSFEPVSAAYQELKTRALNDRNWQTFNFALGETDGYSSIHISGHSPSSSILPMTLLHIDASPGSEYLSEEKIEVKTLDSIYDTLGLKGENIFLKVDTQGYEKKVLDGALKSLSLIKGLQLELSAYELYEGEEIYYSICRFVEERNFRLARIVPGFTHKNTHEMLQFDALFFRK
jgi:FkbM family methyltransferase